MTFPCWRDTKRFTGPCVKATEPLTASHLVSPKLRKAFGRLLCGIVMMVVAWWDTSNAELVPPPGCLDRFFLVLYFVFWWF
jgi:hypothetical protein